MVFQVLIFSLNGILRYKRGSSSIFKKSEKFSLAAIQVRADVLTIVTNGSYTTNYYFMVTVAIHDNLEGVGFENFATSN